LNNIEKWLLDMRGPSSAQNETARREAENDLARQKRQKLDGPKDYEKKAQAQTAKSAKLRELRLAKEAQDRAESAARKPARKPRTRAIGEKA
jgi:hypothetical protein